MIPPFLSQDPPPGEVKLFKALQSDEGAKDWTVLHSLNIARHVRQVKGETDFVVIAPGRGVAVIEVKSHTRVSRTADGLWHMGSQAPTPKGPFDQADGAMRSIHAYLTKARLDMRATPVEWGVWFTHTKARHQIATNFEWQPWQLMDSDDFTAGPAHAIGRLMDQGRAHIGATVPSMASTPPGPSPETARAILSTLRPRFDLAHTTADFRAAREGELLQFLGEQYDALDLMEDNQACLFNGPAGSGKTLLAAEAARRETTQNRSGRLICFNGLLGRHLNTTMAPTNTFYAGNLYAELMRITGLTPPAQPDSAFWEKLRAQALETLLEGNHAADFLIVDETQDLLSDEHLNILDLLVKGGLKHGRCLLFADFDKQALYGNEDGRQDLERRIPHLSKGRLSTNCRNRPGIGSLAATLSEMEPPYKRFRRSDDGQSPTFTFYTDPTDQDTMLANTIDRLREEGFAPHEIVVLSQRRNQSTAATTTNHRLASMLTPAKHNTPRKGHIRYTTIHAFKGLEAPAVILTDVNHATTPNFQALLYVAMTRATDSLTLFVDHNSRKALTQTKGQHS